MAACSLPRLGRYATDWPDVYARIGRILDEVAGSSCADIELTVADDAVSSIRVSGEADVGRRTIAVRTPGSLQDDTGDETDFYGTLLHEVGHVAWNDLGWEQDVFPLKERYYHEIDGRSSFADAAEELGLIPGRALLDFVLGEYLVREMQAQVYALRVASVLAARRSSVIHAYVQRTCWRTLFTCEEGYRFVPLVIYFASAGTDLVSAERFVRRPAAAVIASVRELPLPRDGGDLERAWFDLIGSVNQGLKVWLPTDPSEYSVALEEAEHHLPQLRSLLSRFNDGTSRQACDAVRLLESDERMRLFLQGDPDAVLSTLRDACAKEESVADRLLSLATHCEQDGNAVQASLIGDRLVGHYPESTAAYRWRRRQRDRAAQPATVTT